MYSIVFHTSSAAIRIHHWHHRLQTAHESFTVKTLASLSGWGENLLERNKCPGHYLRQHGIRPGLLYRFLGISHIQSHSLASPSSSSVVWLLLQFIASPNHSTRQVVTHHPSPITPPPYMHNSQYFQFFRYVSLLEGNDVSSSAEELLQ